jgi:crotonobetainyl-CoA:carnitine CoA-transferase CaiB-like acyl-CoA transferase
MSGADLPLDGVTVVSLEQAVAAPFATRQLADLGARVIKVERPGVGDFARGYDETVMGMSSHFVWLNRSKESLALDLRQDEAQEVLRRLVARADVFVQNLAPGAAGRLGFGAEKLREEHPRLVYCSISGYGEDGPYTEKKAYDLLVQCEAGLVSITGTPETPSKVGISAADIAAGMYGYSGILSALYRREKTGEGATLEVSMLEALGEWMGFPAYFAGYSGEEPRRSGAAHAAIAPYGPFGCGDGEVIFLGIQNEREWKKFCEEVLGRAARRDRKRLLRPLLGGSHREARRGGGGERQDAYRAAVPRSPPAGGSKPLARVRLASGFVTWAPPPCHPGRRGASHEPHPRGRGAQRKTPRGARLRGDTRHGLFWRLQSLLGVSIQGALQALTLLTALASVGSCRSVPS